MDLKTSRKQQEGTTFSRLRFGIGDDFRRGQQVDYVLSEWDKNEEAELAGKIDTCIQIIQNYGTIGIQRTMNEFNKRK